MFYHILLLMVFSLADTCFDILNSDERTRGAKNYYGRTKTRKIFERRYHKRGVNQAPPSGAKWVARKTDFRNEPRNGIRTKYNLRADPELIRKYGENVIAMRRFPCACKGCQDKLKLPIDERYAGPCDTCEYWVLFEKEDGSGGYNDWEIIHLDKKANDFVEEDFAESNMFTLETLSTAMSHIVMDGNYGAYVVDDPEYDYYLVKWVGQPYQAKDDEVIELDGEEFIVKEGEWLCNGEWLDRLQGAKRWWYQTDRRCVVRLQAVTNPNLELEPLSDTNKLYPSASREAKQQAREHANETYKISEEDHKFLLAEAVGRVVLDRTYTVDTKDQNNDGEEVDEENPHSDDDDSILDVDEDDITENDSDSDDD